ncbi:short-chain dehydrogenase [Virgisporangium aliadipatigenens]|uniref:Short-chain dehydrogenase n=1 Tax=Virgisporangium aliadipatigenens TaxID=741659 RepID=A0A8J3YGN2_9ACTN|nr:SDR family NAD(P)-dependent oxidoreductase [Virgisporangium aliadipatigenens]GIJ43665.1 short-chain dehydrogenase [Virgisporangium aliadipatigenens]
MSRTIVVTGASSGIGLAAAEQLAAQGNHLVVVGRDERRLAAAVARVRAAGQGRAPGQFRADFERLADVRALADHLLSTCPTIHVLCNNAGMYVGSYRRTEDGHEATMQANHLGPFLLSTLLRERLRGGRIVTTASGPAPGYTIDPDDLGGAPERYRGVSAYTSTKTANILFADEAARRWPDILSVSFYPGLVRTNIGGTSALRFVFRYAPFLISAERGGGHLAWLATAPAEELANGGFFTKRRLAKAKGRVFNPETAARLWEASEAAVR